jgi:transposase
MTTSTKRDILMAAAIIMVICVGMAVLERPAERQKCNGPVEELFTDCAHQRDLISVLPWANPSLLSRAATAKSSWLIRRDRAPPIMAHAQGLHLSSG